MVSFSDPLSAFAVMFFQHPLYPATWGPSCKCGLVPLRTPLYVIVALWALFRRYGYYVGGNGVYRIHKVCGVFTVLRGVDMGLK